ncbi:MAG TPA: carboxypeptidase-like regulatory domain-containing protein [Verrucomicrobiae bacterium]|jgi:hypothetical protein|nr:carboxypeptidase-like regulatory domain-containing protein [Verrucomicrobiae bacterium]
MRKACVLRIESVLMFLLLGLLGLDGQTNSGVAIGSIAGVAADQTGAAIAGTAITATDESNGKHYETTTDQAGRYKLPTVAAGSYTVKFAAQAFKTETKSNVAVTASKVTKLDVRLSVGTCCSGPQITVTGSIVGKVTDRTGAAAANTRVTATNDSTGGSFTTSTDARGSYQFADIDTGSYTLRFEARGFKPATRQSVHVRPTATTHLNIKLVIGDTGGNVIVIQKD